MIVNNQTKCILEMCFLEHVKENSAFGLYRLLSSELYCYIQKPLGHFRFTSSPFWFYKNQGKML